MANMREKYESLGVVALKDLAKASGADQKADGGSCTQERGHEGSHDKSYGGCREVCI